MENRKLGRTARQVSVVGLGCWQLGADWGDVGEEDALAVIAAALDAGVTFLDTADVYGDGRSERLVGRALRQHGADGVTVATKIGRRADPHVPEAFTLEAFRGWLDRGRKNLGVDTIDLVQLHCPPTAVYADDRAFDALDTLVDDQVVAAYGVSVETVDEALTAMARPNVATVQIILNVFRRKPMERVCRPRSSRGWASSPECLWRRGCCPGSTTRARGSRPTTTGPTTAPARRSTSARRSAACRTTSGYGPRARSRPVARRRDHCPARPALDRRPARGEHRDPGSPQRGAGTGERRRCRPGATPR